MTVKKYIQEDNLESKFQRNIILLRYQTEKDFEYCSFILNKFVVKQQQDRRAEFPLQNVPILMGATWASNSAVLNLSINEDDYTHYFKQTESLLKANDLLHDCFSRLFKNRNSTWKSYCKILKKSYNRSLKQWLEWRKAENLSLCPAEYLNLAAWIGLLLNGGFNKTDFNDSDTSNAIYLLKDKLRKMETYNQSEWKAFETFIKKMKYDVNSISLEKPKNKKDFETLMTPIPHGKDGELIVYPPQLLEKLVREQFPNTEPKYFIEQSYRRGLLKTNAKDGDKTYNIKFGETCRTYSFIVSKLNSLLSI